jgi:hypothetical protein
VAAIFNTAKPREKETKAGLLKATIEGSLLSNIEQTEREENIFHHEQRADQ